MESLDSESERKRLTELYSQMSLGELETLAEDATALTDLARDGLRAELARRESNIELRDAVVVPEGTNRTHIVNLRRFRDIQEALLAKNVLDSAGIPCFLADENAIWIGLVLVQRPRRHQASSA